MSSLEPAKLLIEFLISNQITSLNFAKMESFTKVFELLIWDVSQSISDFGENGINCFQYLSMLVIKQIGIATVHIIAQLSKDLL